MVFLAAAKNVEKEISGGGGWGDGVGWGGWRGVGWGGWVEVAPSVLQAS